MPHTLVAGCLGLANGTSRCRWLRSGLSPATTRTTTTVAISSRPHRECAMSRSRHATRRKVLQLGTAATALPLVHIRTAGAAGKLSVGFWDHWVAATNGVMTRQVQAWADRNKVDVHIDFITSNGFKIQVTQAAEAQAGTGHDVLPFYSWEVQTYADRLEPVDDVIQAMEKQYGQYSPIAKYLASSKGQWKAVPSSTGNLNLT